ncbi:cation diffusion facilitator family transporter [Chryseobacterium sp. VAUSW3]|uniref:cation diffusion facilitator family transporter n=1 Tax=Chryseobacterium sp. VAUSW3 TaxID=2010998 RepID=UPI000B4C7052|nr:cation diffusion facilitator family transporter [Chryseobacterium sp. VAUSW3]OWR15719.1 cation diffusion facilitator family transporter [Chryseobacterium sp. VAUSW3]
MENQHSSKTNFAFQKTVAIVGIGLFIGKLIAWHLTNSDAVFSDAMESIVNIIAGFMGLYSLYLAAKPKDIDHPYGHGKVEFVTSGIEGALIIFAGVIILVQAVDSLLHGNVPKKLDWGMLIIAVTAVINYLMGYISVKKGIQENSLVLQSSGKHLQSDTLTTLGVVISLILVYLTKIYWIDAAVALIFGGYIMFVGYKIIRKALSGIMDEADQELLSKMAKILNENRKREWIDIHNTRIQQHGSGLHIDAHLTLPWYFELRKAHEEMEETYKLISENSSRAIEFNFHLDDCKPFSCEICQLSECQVRQRPFVKKIVWNENNISQMDKHDVTT